MPSRYLRRLAATALFLLVQPVPALDDVPEAQLPATPDHRGYDRHPVAMNTEKGYLVIARRLMQWIRDRTGFALAGVDAPRIRFVSREKLQILAFGRPSNRPAAEPKHGALGLYHFEEKTIYLLDTVDLGQPDGKAVLLHELVHFLQYTHGEDKKVNCVKELERLAYLLESEFLSEGLPSRKLDHRKIRQLGICTG